MQSATDHSDKSFWLATYGAYTPNAPVQGDLNVDVAIIGGGFTGLSTAYNLRRDNANMKVAVLESEVIGYGASGRNGGFSMTLFGLEPAITKLLFGQERTIPWPPEPFRFVLGQAVRGYLRIEDRIYERNLPV